MLPEHLQEVKSDYTQFALANYHVQCFDRTLHHELEVMLLYEVDHSGCLISLSDRGSTPMGGTLPCPHRIPKVVFKYHADSDSIDVEY